MFLITPNKTCSIVSGNTKTIIFNPPAILAIGMYWISSGFNKFSPNFLLIRLNHVYRFCHVLRKSWGSYNGVLWHRIKRSHKRRLDGRFNIRLIKSWHGASMSMVWHPNNSEDIWFTEKNLLICDKTKFPDTAHWQLIHNFYEVRSVSLITFTGSAGA